MPILPAEPDLFPEGLWDDEPVERDPTHRWWCLHTKPRQEKVVARELRALQITHYLPMVTQESRTPGGRKIRSVLPLFTSYLFLRGDDRQRVESLRGNHLVNVLDVADQAALELDLRQVYRMLHSGLSVGLEPSHPVGAHVRILSGPLTGMVGTVVRRDNRDRFVAVVRFLGRGAMVDLMDWQAERVED